MPCIARIVLCTCLALFQPGWVYAQQQMTMREAVAEALVANPGIKAARSGVDEGGSALSRSRAEFGPSLSTSYGYSYASQPQSNTSGKEQYIWSLTAKQSLFSGLKHLSGLEKAKLEASSKALQLADTRIGIIVSVQEHFLGYLTAVENIRSAKDALERLRSQLMVTRAFYNEGLRPNLDVLQAEADVSRAELTLIQAEHAMATEGVRLNTLLALPVEAPVVYVGALKGAAFSLSLEECLQYAYANRPDLHMARLAIGIAAEERKVAQSDYYPELNATMNWSTKGDTPGASGNPKQRTGYSQSMAGLQVEWRFFESGRTYFADQEAKHRYGRVREEYEKAYQELSNTMHTQYLAMRDAKRRIEVALKSLSQSTEAFKAAVAHYRSQLGTNTDVLDAQAKLTADEAYVTQARADYLLAIARLYATMGQEHTDLLGDK